MKKPVEGAARQQSSADKPTHWRRAIRGIRGHLIAAAAFSAGLNCLYLASPLFMLQIYDRVLATRSVTTLVFLFAALLIALLALAVLDWARSRLLVRASVALEEGLAEPVTRHVLASGRRPTALRELDQLRQGLSGPAPTALLDLPWSPVFLVVIALIHPLLAVLTAFGALGLFLLSLFSERAVRRSTKRASEIGLAASSGLEACAASSDAVRGLGMRGALVRRHLDDRGEAGTLQTRASLAASGYQVAVRVLRLALQSLVLAVGAYLAITGAITPGAMFAASILAARTLAPIDQLTAGWRSITQAAAARASLAPVLDAEPEDPPMELPAPRGRLDVERVVVRREGAEPVLKVISFGVGPGEILGIAGPSGSGKSTLARALVGADDLQAGAIRLDGAALTQWDQDALGRHIGYLPQQVSLFAGTVGANIARFRGAIAPDDPALARGTVEAATLAGAHEMILRLPRGYETMLGPQGAGLSGGQAQRVALARALFGDPALVVLDEPNSFLDSEGEQALLQAIRKLKERGAAVVLVAHRASAMAMCDRILLLKDGVIELMGERDEIFRGLSQARAKAPAVSAIAGGKT